MYINIIYAVDDDVFLTYILRRVFILFSSLSIPAFNIVFEAEKLILLFTFFFLTLKEEF